MKKVIVMIVIGLALIGAVQASKVWMKHNAPQKETVESAYKDNKKIKSKNSFFDNDFYMRTKTMRITKDRKTYNIDKREDIYAIITYLAQSKLKYKIGVKSPDQMTAICITTKKGTANLFLSEKLIIVNNQTYDMNKDICPKVEKIIQKYS